MPDRLTILFQLTTTPPNAGTAIAHTGGWSESHFTNGDLSTTGRNISDLLDARRFMLPKQGAIIGFRLQKYTIEGAKLVPGGAQTVKRRLSGNSMFETDVPGMALMFGAQGSSPKNGTKIVAKALPDAYVVGGEYSPTPSFTARVDTYKQILQNGGWGFVGRNMDVTSYKIKSIANGLVELYQIPGFDFDVGKWFSFQKCTDTQDRAVVGTYQSNGAVDAQPTKFAVIGLDPLITVTKPNGIVRPFTLAFNPYTAVETQRVVSRKVGRPFEAYRGRASKRRR